MQAYITQRILLGLLTLLGLTILLFLLLRVVVPYSPADILISEYGFRDEELRARLNRELGLDKSIPEQYLVWVGNVLQGDLGTSILTKEPVTSELKERLPVSVEMGLIGLVSAVVISIPLGAWAAARQDTKVDYALRGVAYGLNAIPGFWLALLVITFASIWFNWAPPIEYKSLFADPVEHLQILLLPGLLLGIGHAADYLRLTRAQLLEVLRQDYIRTARSKGLHEQVVLYRHALRNAMLPVITILGLSMPTIIAGTVIFEQIFLIPGMGRYLIDAVTALDYTVIQSTNLLFGALLLASNLLVDLAYGWLDPRVRHT